MNRQENNPPVKSKNRKKIIIGIVIAILLLIGGGIIFYFYQRKPKSQNSDNSPTEEEEEEEDDFKPTDDFDEHGPYKSQGYTDPESGYSTYKMVGIPNITEEKAKEEVITAIYHWGGKNWSKDKLEKELIKNAQRIDLADEKEDVSDIDNFKEFIEKIGKKYQEDIFFNIPSQSEFESKLAEIRLKIFFWIYSFDLKYKNKEIDWIASFKNLIKVKKSERKNKAQKKENFEKATDIIEREINHFILEEGKKFPNLADLKQLNQWANALVLKIEVAELLICRRWYLAKDIGKKILPPNQTRKIQTNDPKLKNKTFNLQPVLTIFKVREEK